VAALILFLGVTAAVEMPTDIFPEIDIPVVSVIWQYTGLNTTEVEQRFTTYSQYTISSNVNGINDIEAETENGISVQKIYFQRDVNLDLRSQRQCELPHARARIFKSGRATGRECAQTVPFLASPESDFFYGQIIPFAGGWTV
jgi:multidrug efflux pump subunit AcrB